MYSILSVTLVYVSFRLVSCGSDPIADSVINFYLNINNFADNSVIAECMVEHSYYEVEPNDSVMIKLHHNAKNFEEIICDIPMTNITYVNETNGSQNILKYYIPSVGQKNLLPYCLFTQTVNTSYPDNYAYGWCQVDIHIKGAKMDPNLKHRTKSIHAYLTVDPMVPNKMRDIIYIKNSTLSVKCIEPNTTGYTHVLIAKDNSGKSTKVYDGNFHGLYHNMNVSFDNMELVCIVTDQRTNAKLKSGITLRYRTSIEGASGLSVVWISVIAVAAMILVLVVGIIASRLHSKFKVKKRARVQSSNNQTNNQTNSQNVENIYDFIYDNVYEDRIRMERAAREAQERREAEQFRPPTPPPVNTIPVPVQVQVQQEVQPDKLRRYSMLTPASDMYLLQIDSEGYQIPEEVQMRGIQLDMKSRNK